MRIIAGAHKGAGLVAPKGERTRPTTDRVRETIFNVLAHSEDVSLEGARALDLFAGSGALGLEALSRGASFALFVEMAMPARAAMRTNIDALGLAGRTRVFRRDATRLGPSPVPPFSLVFCDPPYAKGLGEAALAAAHAGGWVAPGATAVLEERRGHAPGAIPGWALADTRAAGETVLAFFRAT
ncbi:MAG: 16S rRNA (guanine(966)-N(2))-methyltransferase RsmD [Pseudomonadota bacterium]